MQTIKLKQLTIVALAEQDKVQLYSRLDISYISLVVIYLIPLIYVLLTPWHQITQIISYKTLMSELNIDSIRVLEDLIIETIYAVRKGVIFY